MKRTMMNERTLYTVLQFVAAVCVAAAAFLSGSPWSILVAFAATCYGGFDQVRRQTAANLR